MNSYTLFAQGERRAERLSRRTLHPGQRVLVTLPVRRWRWLPVLCLRRATVVCSDGERVLLLVGDVSRWMDRGRVRG